MFHPSTFSPTGMTRSAGYGVNNAVCSRPSTSPHDLRCLFMVQERQPELIPVRLVVAHSVAPTRSHRE